MPDPSIRPDPAALTGEFVSPFARLTLRPGHAPGTVVVASSQRDDVAGWQPPPEPDITFGFFAPDHAVAVDRDGPAAIMRLGTGPAGRTDWVMWGGRRSPRVG